MIDLVGALLPSEGRAGRKVLVVLTALAWLLAFAALAFGAWVPAFGAGFVALVLTLVLAVPALGGAR